MANERQGAQAELRERLWRLRASPSGEPRPPSAYEAVTRQMVEALAEELREIKARLNGLLWMVAGAIVLDLALRLAGAGS